MIQETTYGSVRDDLGRTVWTVLWGGWRRSRRALYVIAVSADRAIEVAKAAHPERGGAYRVFRTAPATARKVLVGWNKNWISWVVFAPVLTDDRPPRNGRDT
jgi:hypothetical protein